MDETGKTIENFGVLGGWKNNIGNFLPGKGYKVNVLDNCTLIIPANATKTAILVPEVLASTHFKTIFEGNGTDHMNINLVNLHASGLQVGDEIGVFDGDLCVGSAMLGSEQLTDGTISIAASANDDLTSTPNGFTSGNRIKLQLFRAGITHQLSTSILVGQPVFEKNESLFAQVKAGDLTKLESNKNSAEIKCYPNPFTQEISIEVQILNLQEICVEIYNLSGHRIKSIYKGTAENHLNLKWNGTNDSGQKVVPGTYLCKVNGWVQQLIFE